MREFVQLDPREPLQLVDPLVWVFWDAEADIGGSAGIVCLLRADPARDLAIGVGLVPVDSTTTELAPDPPDAVTLRGPLGESTPAPAWLEVGLDDGALVVPPDASRTTRALAERFASLLTGPILDGMHDTVRERTGGALGFRPMAWDGWRPGWKIFWSDVRREARPDLYALGDGTRVLADFALCPDPKCTCTRFMVRFDALDATGGRRWLGDVEVAYDPVPIALFPHDPGDATRLRAAWEAFSLRYPDTGRFAECTRTLRDWAGPLLPRRARVPGEAGRCCREEPTPRAEAQARWSA